MRAEMKVFGISMAARNRRRLLVVSTYVVLLVLGFVSWRTLGPARAGSWVIMFSILVVNGLIFGGYGARGLVKPFANRPPREESVRETLAKLELEKRTPLRFGSPDWQNDERELRRRDRVHYQAYQAVALGLLPMWLLSGWALQRPHWMPDGLLPMLLYGVSLPAAVLVITLPQAILLWTEPDVEA